VRCIDAFGAGGDADALASRARFLAWPLTRAAVLVAKSDDARAALAATLRAEQPASRIALVLEPTDLRALRVSPALLDLASSATRLMEVARSDLPAAHRALLERFAGASSDDGVSWLALPTHAVMIVPRIAALATLDAFVEEIRARTRGIDVAWAATPSP
jgi:hypothetical protein